MWCGEKGVVMWQARCDVASGRPMFSVVASHTKYPPSGVLPSFVIDSIQAVATEENTRSMLRLATVLKNSLMK